MLLSPFTLFHAFTFSADLICLLSPTLLLPPSQPHHLSPGNPLSSLYSLLLPAASLSPAPSHSESLH